MTRMPARRQMIFTILILIITILIILVAIITTIIITTLIWGACNDKDASKQADLSAQQQTGHIHNHSRWPATMIMMNMIKQL